MKGSLRRAQRACTLVLALLLAPGLAQAGSAPEVGPSALAKPASAAPRTGLTVAGGVALGLGYLPCAAIAVESLRFGHAPGALLFLPVVGPFLSAAVESGRHAHPLLLVALAIEGVLQAAGATSLYFGLVSRSAPEPSLATARRPRFHLDAGMPGAPAGLTLTVSNF